MTNLNWRLPDGVEEFLPPVASSLEVLRRRVLDVFRSWGFSYIEPPIIEYLEGLLVGTEYLGQENDLDLQTIKVIDQRSGRLLGIRSDMTAQAIRIDAHSLASSEDKIRRLCYAGPVVQANPTGVFDTRVPIKAGAEIFGSASLDADAQVIALMLDVLENVGVEDPVIVLGHMGIYSGLVQPYNLGGEIEKELFKAVQAKSQADIKNLLKEAGNSSLMENLPLLMGEIRDLPRSVKALSKAPKPAITAMEELERLASVILSRFPGLKLRFDLAELAGYGYHNGPVFTAYQPNIGRAIARGGRYDGIGESFGLGRPATGFDISIQQLVSQDVPETAIWVKIPEDAVLSDREVLDEEIRRLRSSGENVVVSLAGEDVPPMLCDRELVLINERCDVKPLARSRK